MINSQEGDNWSISGQDSYDIQALESLGCPSGVTHVKNTDKTSVSASFNANSSQEPLFIAIVVKDFNTFWIEMLNDLCFIP